MFKGIVIYLVVINIIAYFEMWTDKRKAIKHKYRIPERQFFITALLGGSIGSLIGMYQFRHKTKHRSFVVGMPLLLIINVLTLIFIYLKYTNLL